LHQFHFSAQLAASHLLACIVSLFMVLVGVDFCELPGTCTHQQSVNNL